MKQTDEAPCCNKQTLKTKTTFPGLEGALVALACLAVPPNLGTAADSPKTEANVVTEISFDAAQPHPEPFAEVVLDVVFTDPAGGQKIVPAFWVGGKQWKVRYSSPVVGTHRYRTQCNDTGDAGLHAVEGTVKVTPYTGENPLYRHGLLQIARDHRHFEHADGTPFFWLGDTWWKCLCKRMTWEGFQELTADRKAKGFSVIQIVCGPYPDEGVFEARWENEGGKPYLDRAKSLACCGREDQGNAQVIYYETNSAMAR